MQDRFKTFENEEVDQTQFIDIMVESNQFKSKKDAQHYFELLDIDKNGNVSFSELFAPLIPQLTKDQVKELTAETAFTVEDISTIRNTFNELLIEIGGSKVNQSLFKEQFKTTEGSLKRAYMELMILWP